VAEPKKIVKKEEPEGGAKPKPKPKPKPKLDVLPQKQAAVIKKILESLEKKLTGDQMKASLGDYIRLVQLQKELDEESPREIKVTWNQSVFTSLYGHALATIAQNDVNPADYPDEVAYLPTVIGNFTAAIMEYVRVSFPACRFEVLYPTDVNQTAFNRAVNYPSAAWTPSSLTCLKTESFGFTLTRNLDKCWDTLEFGTALGFGADQRAHLVGIGDFSNSA